MPSEEKVRQVYPKAILQRPMQVSAGKDLAIWEPVQECWIGRSVEGKTQKERAESAWSEAWRNIQKERP